MAFRSREFHPLKPSALVESSPMRSPAEQRQWDKDGKIIDAIKAKYPGQNHPVATVIAPVPFGHGIRVAIPVTNQDIKVYIRYKILAGVGSAIIFVLLFILPISAKLVSLAVIAGVIVCSVALCAFKTVMWAFSGSD